MSLHSLGYEVMSQHADLTMNLTVGVSLVLIDQVVLIGMDCREFPNGSHVWRCRCENLCGHSVNINHGGGEGRPRGVKFGTGLKIVLNHPPIFTYV